MQSTFIFGFSPFLVRRVSLKEVRFVLSVSQRLLIFKQFYFIFKNIYVMADYTIKCQANSLLEYTPAIPPPSVGQIRFYPFFTVDYKRDEILKLIIDGKRSKAAGICIVSGYEDINVGPLIFRNEKIYAFRVEWDGDTLVRNPDLNSNQVVQVIINAMPLNVQDFPGADPNVISVVEDGLVTWSQQEIEKYKPDMIPFFTFFDVYTLRKLLADPGCTHLRFRKALIKTKTRKLQTQNANEPEPNFLNFIVESVPTLDDKVNNLAIQPNVITDEDSVAHDYGYPCPPRWIPVPNNIQKGIGYGIVKRSQTIRVANGVVITMGDVVDALSKNIKAKALAKNWKLYSEPKVLRVSIDGKRVILE
jgi:hypothetical protein